MASQKPRQRQPERAASFVDAECFGGIVRTCRLMPTARPEKIKHRRKRAFVEPERTEGGRFDEGAEHVSNLGMAAHFRYWLNVAKKCQFLG